MKFPSYDEIVKSAQNAESVETKKAVNQQTRKMKVRSKIRSKMDQSHIAYLDSKERFETAVLESPDTIDAAALDLKTNLETNNFYTDLYNNLFPEPLG